VQEQAEDESKSSICDSARQYSSVGCGFLMESELGREEVTLRQRRKESIEPPVMRQSVHSLAFSVQVAEEQISGEESYKLIPSARDVRSFLINPSRSPKKSLSPARSPMKRIPSQTHNHPIEVF